MKWVRDQEWAPQFLLLWEKGKCISMGELGLQGDGELKAGRRGGKERKNGCLWKHSIHRGRWYSLFLNRDSKIPPQGPETYLSDIFSMLSQRYKASSRVASSELMQHIQWCLLGIRTWTWQKKAEWKQGWPLSIHSIQKRFDLERIWGSSQ